MTHFARWEKREPAKRAVYLGIQFCFKGGMDPVLHGLPFEEVVLSVRMCCQKTQSFTRVRDEPHLESDLLDFPRFGTLCFFGGHDHLSGTPLQVREGTRTLGGWIAKRRCLLN